MLQRSLSVAGACFAISAGFLSGVAAASPVIVELRPGTDAASHAASRGISPASVYDEAIDGYAANLSSSQTKAMKADGSVLSVTADERRRRGLAGKPAPTPDQPAQFVSSAVRRVGALESPTARIDGVNERIGVDVAVVDGGVQPDHPDLRVVGGKDCGPGGGWWDRDGHGTMVAGFVGALDNAIGRVGVAPGARIWSVRVADPDGYITDGDLICGLDWIAKRADTIDVANLSLAEFVTESAPCGSKRPRPTPVQRAVCTVYERGVTVTAAAGNESVDASGLEPALMPEVITVSAIADSDGLPGGLGGPLPCTADDSDDRFASFSNFGAPVDIAAPGVCVSSTFIGSQYAGWSGTSFSTPLVSGAAALYLSQHPRASPTEVRAALLASAEAGPILGDPDPFAEGVLDVSGL